MLRGPGCVCRWCWMLLLMASIVPSANAQMSGEIEGTVADSQGLAVPGVTVTLAAKALITPQVAVTLSDGSYRFHALGRGAGVGRGRRDDHGDGRRARGRRQDDGAGQRLRRGRTAGGTVSDRRMGGAGTDGWCPDAGIRRWRLAQEPADQLRELRCARPEPRSGRRRRYDGRRGRHRILFRLLLDRGVHDDGGGQRRGDDRARLARHDDDEERRQ